MGSDPALCSMRTLVEQVGLLQLITAQPRRERGLQDLFCMVQSVATAAAHPN